MAKRKHGDGSVFERKDGRWEGRLVVGYKENGYAKTKSVTAPTKTECEEKLGKLREEVGRRSERIKPDMLFGDWLDFWYQNFSKPKLRPTTQACYSCRSSDAFRNGTAWEYRGGCPSTSIPCPR